MDGPPINNAYLRLCDGKLVEMGKADSGVSKAAAVDLGDTVLLPRLVNAHTHTEFSDQTEPIGEPGVSLARWIGQVLRRRGASSDESRARSIDEGIRQSTDLGVGLIGDIATTPSRYPRMSDANVVSFAEVLGLSPERAEERFESAVRHRAALLASEEAGRGPIRFGVSPHAPYSTPMDLIERAVELAIDCRAPLAMHVAESPDERELLLGGTGPFRDALEASGLWPEGIFPWGESDPIGVLVERLSRAPRALLVHGNDLTDQEIARVASHPNLTVVYCPRTHGFFRHAAHPVDKLMRAGVRVAIGTDSRASNPDLSVWGEVRHLLQHRQDLEPYRVLQMATRCGAEALLGAGSGFGIIRPGQTPARQIVAFSSAAETRSQLWRDLVIQESPHTDPLFGS